MWPALIPAPGTRTGRTGGAAAEKFKAMKSLFLGIELIESSCFFSLLIGTCDASRRKGSIFSVGRLSPNIQQLAGEVAARLSHPCAGLGLHFSSCFPLGATKEREEPEERCDGPRPTRT